MGSSLSFKGNISVSVDQTLLQAAMTLTRAGDMVWDEGAVLKVLSDAGVKEGFAIEQVLDVIQKFHRSKEDEKTEVVAQGLLPEPPKPEEWIWKEDLQLGETEAEISRRVLKTAPLPEIYSLRIEKVKVEKKQEAKGSLFGKGQEETVVVVENREVRDKVLVDPHVEKVFYVEAGGEVAALSPQKPGKPGRDLGGRPLPPPALKPAPFFPGKNLQKQKTGVTAQCSGFLRIGKNWADVVPFARHHWELSFSADKSSVFLSFFPGHPESPLVDVQEILTQVQAEGFPLDRLYPAERIQKILDDALAKKQNISAIPLTDSRDARYEIVVSPDKTKAWLNIEKAQGDGKPLVLRELGQSLRDTKFKGFNFETVKASIMEFVQGPSSELKEFILAQGKAPTRGKDKILEFLVDFMTAEEWSALRTRTEADSRLVQGIPGLDEFPLTAVQRATPVSAGQQLAVLKAQDEGTGEPGVDVYGEVLPPIPGNDPPLVLVAQVRKNGDRLEAVQDGLFETADLNGVTYFRVRFHQDARVEVVRSEDNMEAFLTLQQGRGAGRLLDRSQIEEALRLEQVCYGLDENRIGEALKLAEAGQKVENYLIAQGRPPAGDLERRLSFLIPVRRDSQGHRFGAVKEGQAVAEYLFPTDDSSDGQDVLGNLIPSDSTESRLFKVSDVFQVETAGEKQILTALKGGEACFDGESLTIKTQLAVPHVTARTGNLKFNGDVLVEGQVDSGLYILAGGVKIKGQVHGALVSSESNIQVLDGVRGEGKAVLRAKRHVAVGFAEKAVLMAVGDLHVNKTIMGCNVRCNGKVIQKSGGGGLIGGLTKSKSGLDVMNLGSPNGTPTVISFGQDYLIENQIEAEVKETDKLREGIVHLDALMKQLTGPGDKDKLANARKKKVLMMKMLEKRGLKLINLRDKFELHYESEIIVRENLYPGVSIESHGRLYEVKTKKSALKIVFNQNTGHIEEHPLI